ncbi:MAG: nucleotide pyrophosphohydrolase [Nitrospirae bacterium]|nr:nucleotide pyrophosphohydrolase [Nitrospirota bacterium]MBF0540438.1 nucleotide pyrophosphohydrolase [Nitrospirota bacterium]
MPLIASIREFAKQRDWEKFHTPKNLAMALSVEVSEIVEIFQWLTEQESRDLSGDKLQALIEEIGDVQIYLIALADKFGIDTIEAAKKKMTINAKKYPVELVKGKSKKYTEY